MLITFECPNCGTNLEIEADAAGTRLECPACKAAVTVPRKGFGPGATIGGFRIDRLLGRGAMGEVYLARQLSMDRDVALKILPSQVTHPKDLVERFLQEVRLLAKLDHPNIVTAYEAGEDGGVYFMAMAYVNGSPLDVKLRRDGPMPEEQALRLILQIARALAYAWNEHRLIHRDIKPGNIMLDKHGEPRLLDLGLSKSLTGAAEMTLSGTVVGTPNYMSPEQAEGRKADFRSDMYSLGTTLYHLLTGQVPFAGTSIVEVLRKQATETLPDPRSIKPEITAACVALLEIMLAKDPAQRHADWNALIGDIGQVLAGRPPTREPLPAGESVLVRADARPPHHAEAHKRIVLSQSTAQKLQHVEPPKLRKSKRAAALGVAAGLAALLAIGGGFYFASLRDRPAEPMAMEPVTISAPAPAPGGQTAETERLQCETLAGQFAEAMAFQEQHPVEHEELRNRWEQIAQAGSGTEFGDKARAALRQLAEAEQRSEEEAIAQIERQAETLFAAGKPEEAIAGIRNFAGPLADQTQERRRELADRFSQRAEDARQTAAKQAENSQAKLEQVLNAVAAALFRSDVAAAQTALDTAERDATLPSQAGALADLRRTLAAVADMDKRILDSFRDDAGKEVAVGFKTGPQTLKIVSVGSGEVRAQQRFSTAGFAARNFTAKELGLEEKFKRLEGQAAPVRGILRGLLLVQARKPTAAKKHFEESGTPLGAALAAEVNRRMAGAREAEAEKALAGLLVQAGLTPNAEINDELGLKVRQTAYPPAAVVRIRKAAEQYRQAYGDTEKARQADALLVLCNSRSFTTIDFL